MTKERKVVARRYFLPTSILVFLCLLHVGAWADDNFKNQLFNLVKISPQGQVSYQSAELVGVFNVDGWVQTTQGVRSTVPEDDVQIDIIKPTDVGGLCVGDCGDEAASLTNDGDRDNVQAVLTQDQPNTLSSENHDQQETGTTTLGNIASSSVNELIDQLNQQLLQSSTTSSANASSSQEQTVVSEDVSTTSSSTTHQVSSSGSHSRSISQSTNQGDDGQASTTATTTVDVVPIDPGTSTATSTASSTDNMTPIDIFVSQLESVSNIIDGSWGLGMQAISDFRLAIYGWLFTTRGIIVGDGAQRVGIGVTADGICIGQCDFDFATSSSAAVVSEENNSASEQIDTETSTENTNASNEAVATGTSSETTASSTTNENPQTSDQTDTTIADNGDEVLIATTTSTTATEAASSSSELVIEPGDDTNQSVSSATDIATRTDVAAILSTNQNDAQSTSSSSSETQNTQTVMEEDLSASTTSTTDRTPVAKTATSTDDVEVNISSSSSIGL